MRGKEHVTRGQWKELLRTFARPLSARQTAEESTLQNKTLKAVCLAGDPAQIRSADRP